MRQRVALIAKIRAIESVPVIRFKVCGNYRPEARGYVIYFPPTF